MQKRTDKVYLLLCLFSSAMAVLMLASWAAEQGGGFAVDEITGQITGIGDYRRALVQAGASGAGVLIALLLSTVDYRSLVKVWPFHVAFTWGLVLPTLFIHNLAVGPLTIGYNRRRHRQLFLVPAGRLHLPAHRAGQDQLYPDLCHAPEQCPQPDQRAPGAGQAAGAPDGADPADPHPGDDGTAIIYASLAAA